MRGRPRKASKFSGEALACRLLCGTGYAEGPRGSSNQALATVIRETGIPWPGFAMDTTTLRAVANSPALTNKLREHICKHRSANTGAMDEDRLDDAQDSCTVSWERLELKCAYSRLPLVDPAKAIGCCHPPCCNYDDLRAYAGRLKKCPSCAKAILRTRNIERDDELREALQRLPRATEVVWVRGSRVSVDAPSVGGAVPSGPQQQQRARERAKRSAPVPAPGPGASSGDGAGSPRRSKRQVVVAL